MYRTLRISFSRCRLLQYSFTFDDEALLCFPDWSWSTDTDLLLGLFACRMPDPANRSARGETRAICLGQVAVVP